MKTVFGDITDHEKNWLDQELKKVNFGKTVEQLYGIPCFSDPENTRKTLIYPFVYKFFERRKANRASWDAILQDKKQGA